MQNVKVSRYSSSPILSIPGRASLEDAERRLRGSAVSALAVLDELGTLEGVLSRTDLLRVGTFDREQCLRLPDRQVREVMTAPAIVVPPDADLAAAARRMRKERVHRLFVERRGDPLGVLSTRDLMQAARDRKVRTPLGEIASDRIVTAKADDTVALVLDRLERCHKHGVVIVEGDWPIGIFTQLDALWARRFYPTTPVEQAMSLSVLVLPEGLAAYRAAAQALELGVRRILVQSGDEMRIATSFDFTKLFS